MCGIAGILSQVPVATAVLLSMNNAIRHRGPDDEGYALFSQSGPVCFGGNDSPEEVFVTHSEHRPQGLLENADTSCGYLAFGHRRLSIVDLSVLGHQPMSYANGRYWITYNGEIYNHLELRTELEAAGYRFVSHSDTEVILAAYDHWGEECLSRFNGMWAFALYDTKAGTLFFARDRFGVKPLYYWVAPDGALYFGSEIKQFTVVPGWRAQVNGQRAYDFLVWGLTDHTEETLFKHVYQLRPGHSAIVDVQSWTGHVAGGRLQANRWYTLTAQPFTGTFVEAATQFRDKFVDSVALRLRADVAVGSCLSGGLDSSSIVCVANQLLRDQDAHSLQSTFSACADVAKFDERIWIKEVVKKTNVDAHYVVPSLENLFAESPLIAWHQDEPYASTSIYAQWNVFRLAAENDVKVMLDGQGADEQLAGYQAYFAPRLLGLLLKGKWVAFWLEMQMIRRMHGYSMQKLLSSVGSFFLPQRLQNFVRRATGRAYTSPAWLNASALGAEPANPFIKFGGPTNSIKSLSISQLTATNLQMLLHWEDRNSMAHSIESRVPFLDFRLVEFVLGLPDEYKLSSGITKQVQRAGMSGILPDTIRDRRDKLAFVTPEEVWLKELAPDLFRAKLDLAIQRSGGILKPSAREELEDIISGRRPFNFGVWRMISFGEWLDQFSVECN